MWSLWRESSRIMESLWHWSRWSSHLWHHTPCWDACQSYHSLCHSAPENADPGRQQIIVVLPASEKLGCILQLPILAWPSPSEGKQSGREEADRDSQKIIKDLYYITDIEQTHGHSEERPFLIKSLDNLTSALKPLTTTHITPLPWTQRRDSAILCSFKKTLMRVTVPRLFI